MYTGQSAICAMSCDRSDDRRPTAVFIVSFASVVSHCAPSRYQYDAAIVIVVTAAKMMRSCCQLHFSLLTLCSLNCLLVVPKGRVIALFCLIHRCTCLLGSCLVKSSPSVSSFLLVCSESSSRALATSLLHRISPFFLPAALCLSLCFLSVFFLCCLSFASTAASASTSSTVGAAPEMLGRWKTLNIPAAAGDSAAAAGSS
jgi:hypothetical protein